MAYNCKYKALWIDDQEFLPIMTLAESLDIDLVKYESLHDGAIDEFEKHFDEYDAVILDAYCYVSKEDGLDENFLNDAIPEIREICARRREKKPWYVFSAGTCDDFGRTINSVIRSERKRMDEEWGKSLYMKDAPEKDIMELLNNIVKVGSARWINRVRALYPVVFEIIESDKFSKYSEMRMLMMDVLRYVHFPEELNGFKPSLYYTQIRRCLEYVFRGLMDYCIIPNEVPIIDESKHLNLANVQRYLGGKETKYGKEYQLVHGDVKNKIANEIVRNYIDQILHITGIASHTAEITTAEADIVDNLMNDSYMLHSFVFQVCDIIRWAGNYIDQHPYIMENRDMWIRVPVKK